MMMFNADESAPDRLGGCGWILSPIEGLFSNRLRLELERWHSLIKDYQL